MRIYIGIPARMGSTRFPGKPLCNILNKSMIQHCYIRSSFSKYSTNLFVATCDEEIKNHVESFGGKVIMTDKDQALSCSSCYTIKFRWWRYCSRCTGNEPLIHPDMIDNAIEPLLNEKDILFQIIVPK